MGHPIKVHGEMAKVSAARATITKANAGYRLNVVIWETGRARLLVDKATGSVPEAEAAAQFFTTQHRIPWYTVEVLYR